MFFGISVKNNVKKFLGLLTGSVRSTLNWRPRSNLPHPWIIERPSSWMSTLATEWTGLPREALRYRSSSGIRINVSTFKYWSIVTRATSPSWCFTPTRWRVILSDFPNRSLSGGLMRSAWQSKLPRFSRIQFGQSSCNKRAPQRRWSLYPSRAKIAIKACSIFLFQTNLRQPTKPYDY